MRILIISVPFLEKNQAIELYLRKDQYYFKLSYLKIFILIQIVIDDYYDYIAY